MWAFLKDPSLYLSEFQRKTKVNSEQLGRQARPGFEPGTSRLEVLSVTTLPLVGLQLLTIYLSYNENFTVALIFNLLVAYETNGSWYQDKKFYFARELVEQSEFLLPSYSLFMDIQNKKRLRAIFFYYIITFIVVMLPTKFLIISIHSSSMQTCYD